MIPAQPQQLALLVRVPEAGQAGEHRVVGRREWFGPPERDVQLGEQGELARGCRPQVTRAEDEVAAGAVGEEHAPNLRAGTDNAGAITGSPAGPSARRHTQLGSHIR